jgi:hypothetical protein
MKRLARLFCVLGVPLIAADEFVSSRRRRIVYSAAVCNSDADQRPWNTAPRIHDTCSIISVSSSHSSGPDQQPQTPYRACVTIRKGSPLGDIA